MELQIELKSVYGETKAYPACEKARTLADMLRTKTLTRAAIAGARSLGFSIVVVDAWGGKHQATNGAAELSWI